jgi:predicted secreted protein
MLKKVLLSIGLFTSVVSAHHDPAKVWKISDLNSATMALYGREVFSHIRKSDHITVIAPTAIAQDPQNIPIGIKSDIKAKSVAIFQDANAKSLTAIIDTDENSIIDYELNIIMERKGTVFVVIEGLDGQLYYKRAFIYVICLPCMAQGME